METIINILKEINPGIDVNRTDFIDGHILDSLAILSVIAELEDIFDLMIPAVEITAENFNSVKSLYKMVERLSKEG